MNTREVVLVAPVRTPIGRFGGGLASLSAADLGVAAAVECLRRAGVDPASVDEAIVGCGRQAGSGPNVGRQVSYRAGLGAPKPAYTVNQACASGLRAIVNAAMTIQSGAADLVLAAGTESMSRLPYFLEGARWGWRLGHQQVTDAMYRDGFLDPLCGLVMGETAENLADTYQITREEQDQFAAGSQNRAEAARREGRFQSEIVPVDAPAARGATTRVEADEHPRDGVTADSLASLPAVFRKTGGTVTAGNSSGITDGAAAVLVTSAERAARDKLEPWGRLVSWTVSGVEPAIMGIGPVPAIRALEERTRVRLADIDLVELNEAFAAQVIACDRELKFDPARLNVNGGAIALGHPIGATGVRIVVTLLHEMRRRAARRGLATLCVSGGMGVAALIEAC